jgi:hypothetical protein
MNQTMPYLAVCSMYRDHAHYLREWIEFHRLVGVERFFLYDNGSADDHLEVLAPYTDGEVVVHPWSSPASVKQGAPWGLSAAFDDCLRRHRHDARWIAFIDVDEFIFSPTGRRLPEVLTGFEAWPGVCVSRVDYGTSGHRSKPPGLVIESYLHRRSYESGYKELVKSIVDPARTRRCFNAHRFLYEDGFAVDENGRPLDESAPNRSDVSLSLLRVNHYLTKSEEEYREKAAQWTAAGMPRSKLRPAEQQPGWLESLQGEYDDAITAYVPDLREALARVRG